MLKILVDWRATYALIGPIMVFHFNIDGTCIVCGFINYNTNFLLFQNTIKHFYFQIHAHIVKSIVFGWSKVCIFHNLNASKEEYVGFPSFCVTDRRQKFTASSCSRWPDLQIGPTLLQQLSNKKSYKSALTMNILHFSQSVKVFKFQSRMLAPPDSQVFRYLCSLLTTEYPNGFQRAPACSLNNNELEHFNDHLSRM